MYALCQGPKCNAVMVLGDSLNGAGQYCSVGCRDDVLAPKRRQQHVRLRTGEMRKV